MLVANTHRRSALAAIETPTGNESITLSERQVVFLMQINGAPTGTDLVNLCKGIGLTAAAEDGRVMKSQDLCLMWNGPGMWVAESDSDRAISRLGEAFSATDATITDISHGRTVIRVDGRKSVALLSKGCSFDIESMQSGQVISSLLSHMNIMLHRVQDQAFDIYVLRSFGESLHEWLVDAAREWSN